MIPKENLSWRKKASEFASGIGEHAVRHSKPVLYARLKSSLALSKKDAKLKISLAQIKKDVGSKSA